MAYMLHRSKVLDTKQCMRGSLQTVQVIDEIFTQK